MAQEFLDQACGIAFRLDSGFPLHFAMFRRVIAMLMVATTCATDPTPIVNGSSNNSSPRLRGAVSGDVVASMPNSTVDLTNAILNEGMIAANESIQKSALQSNCCNLCGSEYTWCNPYNGNCHHNKYSNDYIYCPSGAHAGGPSTGNLPWTCTRRRHDGSRRRNNKCCGDCCGSMYCNPGTGECSNSHRVPTFWHKCDLD